MRVAVLNGNPDPDDKAFEGYLDALGARLRAAGHSVRELRLRELELAHCTGCFGCWLVKPGRCLLRDGMGEIHREFLGSDVWLFASPLKMGFVSSLLRKANERLIPLLLPYVTLVQGECHHVPRYERYPVLGLLLKPGADTDAEDVELTVELYRRQAINFHTRLGFAGLTELPVEEVADALARA